MLRSSSFTGSRSPLSASTNVAQKANLCTRRVFCGKPGRHALEPLAHRKQLAQLIIAHMGDDQPTLRAMLGEAHGMQPVQRLTHRRAADAESLCKLHFGQSAAGPQFTLLDERRDMVQRAAPGFVGFGLPRGRLVGAPAPKPETGYRHTGAAGD